MTIDLPLIGLLSLLALIVLAAIRYGRPSDDGYYFEPLADIQRSKE